MLKRLKWPLASIVAALLMATGLASAQTYRQTNIDWLVAKRILNTGISTLRGAVEMSGSATVGNDLSVADDLTTVDFLTTKQTAIVVTAGSTVTPTGFYQPISSTGAFGTSSIAGCTAGRRLLLVNVGASTITFTDTGTLKLSGNAVLGVTDNLSLVCDGTNWIQTSKVDN